MRTFEYFRPVDIKHGKGLCLGNSEVTFIKIGSRWRLNDVVKIILSHTANGKLGILSGQVTTDVNAGREGGNVKTFLNAKRLHLLTGKSSNGNANILQDVVRLDIYLVDYNADKIPAVGAALGRFFDPDHLPANTLLGIQALALPEFLVEVTATAVVDA